MQIMFWNVQRLGAATDDARIETIRSIYGRVAGMDYVFLCELTPGCDFPVPQNLTYRRKNSSQLCYGAINCETGQSIELEQITPYPTDDFKQAQFKGGLRFSNFTNRAVGKIILDGVAVHVYHAPASGNAKKAVSYLACYLNEHYGRNPWILIGDLNITPEELSTIGVGIELDDLIIPPDAATHISRTRDTMLDYALGNFSARVQRVRCSSRYFVSDHYPIIITW